MTSWLTPTLVTALTAAVAGVGLVAPPGATGSDAAMRPAAAAPVARAGASAVAARGHPSVGLSEHGSPLPASSLAGSSGRWAFPLEPRPLVLAGFHAPPGPYAAGHRGVDLAAATGDSVRSPTVGTLAFAGVVAGRTVVVINHPDGLRSTLEPVTATVPVGTPLARGEAVGRVDGGPGHCAPRTCVHWGVLRGATYLDPLRLVTVPRVVLLPVGR